MNNLKRREFLSKCCKGSLAACGMLMASKINGMSMVPDDEKPDPKKLNYCGYQCPADCKYKRATIENNIELKKEAYKDWGIKEKYGLEFDAETMFCNGCKTDKPLGLVVKKCSVRNCAISKNYDCCIQCSDLPVCDKEIWKTFPQFRDSMIALQKKYLS
jgi:hypothetical protein